VIRRILALASLLLAVDLPLPTWASTTHPVDLTLHARQTIVGGRGATRAIVTIPAPVRLPGHSNCLLSDTAVFSGTAQQAAVFLTGSPLRPDGPQIWITSFTLGGQRGRYDSECLSTQIPPGRYLLQYVHSPGTSSVRLTFPGLRGTGTLRATGRDASVITQLPAVTDTPARPSTATWGTRRTLADRGSVLTLGALDTGLVGAGFRHQGDCLLGPELRLLPDAVAYAPECPLGGSGSLYGTTGDGETWQATMTSGLAPGSYGAGHWFAGTPTYRPLGAVSVWLTNLTG
jgi:hypothetical protein